MPISIDFLANVNPFVRETKDVEKTLDQVGDSLDDVARDGDKATEKLERGFRDLSSTAKRESAETGNALAKNIDDGTRKAGEAAEELGDELRGNIGETFSSFRGDIEDFGQIAQDTLGGLAGSGALGGIPGLAVTAAGAAGLGLLIGAFETMGEQGEAFRQKVSEIATELIETGGIGQTSLEWINEQLKTLATNTEDGADNLAKLRQQARNAASGFDRIAQAYAGNADQLDEIIDREKERLDLLEDQITTQSTWDVAGHAMRRQQVSDQKEIVEGLEEQRTAIDEAAKAEQAYLAAGGPEMESKIGLVNAINDAYDEAAASVDEFINEETGLFDVDAYIASMEERAAALADYQNALLSSGLTTDAKNFLNEQGAEAAAVMLAGYQSAAPEKQRKLAQLWAEAGRDDSGSYLTEIETGIAQSTLAPPSIAKPTIPLPDEAALLDFLRKKRTLQVTVEAVTRTGQKVL